MNRTRADGRSLATTIVVALAACGGSGGSKADAEEAGRVHHHDHDGRRRSRRSPACPTRTARRRAGRCVSIKIDNDSSAARPQTGIDAADIVWDEVVEGEATRFLAMFQSQVPDVVGPVRSVRLTDPLIVWPVGGVFAYSGGAKYAVDAINQAPVVRIDESAAGDAMFRDSARRPPHNLYAKPSLLFTKGGTPVPPPPLFDYVVEAGRRPGRPASAVHIAFANQEFAPTYTWDAASGTWKRSTRAGPFVVKSGAQIAPKNVVVLPVVYGGTGVGQHRRRGAARRQRDRAGLHQRPRDHRHLDPARQGDADEARRRRRRADRADPGPRPGSSSRT